MIAGSMDRRPRNLRCIKGRRISCGYPYFTSPSMAIAMKEGTPTMAKHAAPQSRPATAANGASAQKAIRSNHLPGVRKKVTPRPRRTSEGTE
jgi:hypothetical protein